MGPGDTARGVQGRLESDRRLAGSDPRVRRELVALRGRARGWPRTAARRELGEIIASIDIRWLRIRFGISTHDAGHRITDLDFARTSRLMVSSVVLAILALSRVRGNVGPCSCSQTRRPVYRSCRCE